MFLSIWALIGGVTYYTVTRLDNEDANLNELLGAMALGGLMVVIAIKHRKMCRVFNNLKFKEGREVYQLSTKQHRIVVRTSPLSPGEETAYWCVLKGSDNGLATFIVESDLMDIKLVVDTFNKDLRDLC